MAVKMEAGTKKLGISKQGERGIPL